MYILALTMSYTKGSIARVGVSERLHTLETPAEIPRLLPPVLKLVHNCAMVTDSTFKHLEEASSSISLKECNELYPLCFFASERKRNHDVAFSD